MISVELWRARIGLFNSKCYSGFLSSLFSSYVPFKFHRRRKRSSNVDTHHQDLERPSSAAQPPSPSASNSNDTGTPSSDESPAVCSHKRSLLSFSWTSLLPTSFPLGLLSSCLLREALVRLVLLIAIISQVLIISGDVETNPGPDLSECCTTKFTSVLNFDTTLSACTM